MWQTLYDELKEHAFTIIAVAFDSAGAAPTVPWIRAASPTYPCLIDERHLVAELYDMVNVPSAVWINESGRIVRPTEPAGVGDEFRTMDHETYRMPDDAIRRLRRKRNFYLNAVRDWVAKGDESTHALSEQELRRQIAGPTEDDAFAAANFRLGVYLHENGYPDDAQHYFEEAKRLRPQSWNYRRQAWSLEEPNKAGGPEFWKAVEALDVGRYYPPVKMDGFPD